MTCSVCQGETAHLAGCPGLYYIPEPTPRSDSDRYAELRLLVEAWQSHTTGSSQALADWRHR